jgi:N4-gp56 family major capsid protein
MAINLTTKYSPKVAERFYKSSLTGAAASTEYDFEGIKTLKVYSVDTVPLGNYTRSGTSRYGTPDELGDTVQEMIMTQDRAFTYTIDKGNEKEQLNIKAATKSLKRQIDERVIPEMDKYRLDVWCKKAGSQKSFANAVTKNNITEYVMDCTELIDEAFAPESGRTMWITNAYYKLLKQNPDFIGIDKLGTDALVKGQVGEIDGMRVVKVPNSWLPDGVMWLITHKSAILAPAKLQDYKIHKDPPGVNGDLVEGRIIHDAFVIGSKANAVCVAIEANYKTNAPTFTDDATNNVVTIAADTNAAVYYTIDGSDPRYSTTVITADVTNGINRATLGNSATVKGYAALANHFDSPVTEFNFSAS